MFKNRFAAVSLLLAAGALFLLYSLTGHRPVAGHRSGQTTKRAEVFAELRPLKVRAAAFAVSEKVSGFAPARPSPENRSRKMGRAGETARAVDNKEPFRKIVPGAVHDADANPAVFQDLPMPPPLVSFEGLSSRDNAAAYGFRVFPPDANGDVGPDHYVQTVNILTRVYDKTGVPLTPPFKLSSLFAPLGTGCAARDDGDPVVLYDALADRWLISQFCKQFPPFRQMIAVSKTGDPTGEYYIYEFVMPNNKLNDYPKFGVWPDAYYMSTDEFFGSTYAGSGVFAFDREKMLRGDPAAGYIYLDLASPSTIRLGGLLPVDFDGLDHPPPAGAAGMFIGYAATEYGYPQDMLRLFEFRPDFADPVRSTFAERAESPLPVAAFDPTSPAGRADINQPPPGAALDAQSDRLMFRAAYRNLGSGPGGGAAGSIVVNQTVRVTGPGEIYRAGVRVYELRQVNGVYTVREQTTIGSADTSRWMGSAAQDAAGNLAVGYSSGNEDKPPSIAYAGKLAGDPPGVFRRPAALIRGTGVQKAFGFRWGDYTALSVDPADDCTFWLTNQYYTPESQEESDFGWLTRIGSFKFAECSPAERAAVRVRVLDAVTRVPIENARIAIFPDGDRGISPYLRTTGPEGETPTLKIAPRLYRADAAASGYRPETAEFSASGGPGIPTFVVTVLLEPAPVFASAETRVAAESCRTDNAIDPGETVTLDITLRNTGAADASELTAELLERGGVLNPSDPQNYGALPAGGPPPGVSRPFTFSVSPNLRCGRPLTLTLALRDGAEDLGTVSADLPTGTLRVALSENFDTVAAPDLPAGWLTSAEGGQEIWKTSAGRFESAPHAVFSPDPRQVGLNELISPAFPVATAEAVLTFRNWYELETTFLRNRLYDGSVLEIKIGSADWQDILEAGGSFESGGYDGTIDGCCQNPLAGRLGWSGRSGVNRESEFITTRARLPAAAAGREIRLRWRVGTDIGTFREGQYLDDIRVTDGAVCRCTTASGGAPFDFDGDGRTDQGVYRPAEPPGEADFLVRRSGDGQLAAVSWGSPGDRAVPADYDGDDRTDFAVYRPSSKTWFVLQSGDNSIFMAEFGAADDLLVPADYDGDARADAAVYRPSTGTWFILRSTDGRAEEIRFGLKEDLPVPADYDGDDRTDPAVWRPSDGTFYILNSSDQSITTAPFGLAGDRPVAGDFDADGRADLTVYRPAEGIWYLLRSQDGFTAVRFGLAEDRPLQADFDGDGRLDVAVYRPSTAVWYYLQSSDGQFRIAEFGTAGDTALPAIFVR